MAAMYIDLDVSGNTATSVGPLDVCLEVKKGDTTTLDVTAEAIPASYPMIAFGFDLNFPPDVVNIESADADFLLGSEPGSNVFDASDPLPESDGQWTSAATDIGKSTPESGSGVLQRITLSIDPSAPSGLHSLFLSSAAHIDPGNEAHPPVVVLSVLLAVETVCESGSPSPTATISPGPVPGTPICQCAPPTPTPTPAILPDAGGLAAALPTSPSEDNSPPIELFALIGAVCVGAGLAASVHLWRSGRRRPR